MGNQCVRYYGWFAVLTGSKSSAIAISQLFYWYEKMQRKFYKTDKQLMEDTWLNHKEIQRAKVRFKSLDFMTISVEGSPPKTYYDFNINKLNEHLKLMGLDPSKCHNITEKTDAQYGQNVHFNMDKMSISIWTKCPYLPYTKNTNNNTDGFTVRDFGVNGISVFDDKRAKQLYEALAIKRKIMRQPNLKQWTKEFHNLRKEGVQKNTITKVLRWYSDHVGERFVPAAYAAKTFREKFQNIIDAMERSGVSLEEIEISETTKKLAKIKNIPADKLSAMQTSLNLCNRFLEKAKELEQTTARKLVLEKFGNPNHLVSNWISEKSDAMQISDLEKYGRDITKKICGSANRWSSLFGDVIKCL